MASEITPRRLNFENEKLETPKSSSSSSSSSSDSSHNPLEEDINFHPPESVKSYQKLTQNQIDSLFQIDIDKDNNKFLTIQDKESFTLFKESNSSPIYIRPSYVDIVEILMSSLVKNKFSTILVTSNPGIGKTYFGYFLLYHLLNNTSKSIVFQCSNSLHPFYVFVTHQNSKKRTLYSIRSKESMFVSEYLGKDDIIYICDDSKNTPHISRSLRIIISSPNPIRVKLISKSVKFRKLIMPIWSEYEINCVYKKMYSVFDNEAGKLYELFNTLYGYWGGIPREIFKINNDKDSVEEILSLSNIQIESKIKEEYIKELNHTIINMDPSLVINNVGENSQDELVSHKIIHTVPVDSEYFKTKVCFGSQYIKQRMAIRLSNSYFSNIYEKIKFKEFSNSFGLNWYFEIFSHRIISNGFEFKVRPMGCVPVKLFVNGIFVKSVNSDKDGNFNFENVKAGESDRIEFQLEETDLFKNIEPMTRKNSSSTKRFIETSGNTKDFSTSFKFGKLNVNNFNSITSTEINSYNIPNSLQFACVDSFYYTKEIMHYFQITTSIDHPIKSVPFQSLITNLISSGSPTFDDKNSRFYFVVPDNNYDKFKYQPYKDADDHNTLNGPKIKQFVISICLESCPKDE